MTQIHVTNQELVINTGRTGGRTLTEQLDAADGTKDFWDLGGEWVGRYVVVTENLLILCGLYLDLGGEWLKGTYTCTIMLY